MRMITGRRHRFRGHGAGAPDRPIVILFAEDAPTRGVNASSLGTMPTTLVRRLTAPPNRRLRRRLRHVTPAG